MLSGNQGGTYYDIWALRTYDDWMTYDLWEGIKQGYGPAKDSISNSTRKTISKDSVIPVISAFGGIAIYKTKFIKRLFLLWL